MRPIASPSLQTSACCVIFLAFPFLSFCQCWQTWPPLTTEMLNDVYFITVESGWIVGTNGTILSTADGGNTWTIQNSFINSSLNAVHFIDRNRGWVVGSQGTILQTINGGISWIPKSLDTDSELYDITFTGESKGWITGSCGSIFLTSDGGETWNPDTTTSHFNYTAIGLDQEIGLCVSNGEEILRSTDSGQSWQPISQLVDIGLQAVAINGLQAIAVGLDMWISSDGGQTWEITALPNIIGTLWLDAVTVGRGEWIVGGEKGKIKYTNDHGQSWSYQNSGTTDNINGLFFLDRDHGWAVGDNGAIFSYLGCTSPIDCRVQDSLELVALYEATGGSQWINTWDLQQPIDSWFGIEIDSNGCVTNIELPDNGLAGCLPMDISIICNANIDLSGNTKLAWMGNVQPYCGGSTQIGAPCDDGDINTDNDIITSDCECVGTQIASENCRMKDSLELVRFYNAVNGPEWSRTWDIEMPINTWYGVQLTEKGCVNCLKLDGVGSCDSIGTTGNGLVGEMIDLNLPELTRLYLSNNALTGVIPDFSNMGKLEYLDLVGNQLSGSVPDFSSLPSLMQLSLGHNQLTDTIPNFTNLSQLRWIDMQENKLTGNIPDFLNCPDLIGLYLTANKLDGNIPNFSNLPKLKDLFLDQNQLEGNIPDFSDLSSLINLDLATNNLNGNIPDFASLPNLEKLYLYENRLVNSIPNFSDLPNLTDLYVDKNQLSGNPPDFSSCPKLKFIDLAENLLSGNVSDYSDLPDLAYLTIANNEFTFGNLISGLESIENTIERNAAESWHGYYYAPQDSIFSDTVISIIEGKSLTIDLQFDEGINSNTYTWYKNNEVWGIIESNNDLSFPAISFADTGVYRVAVTNLNVPGLTLYSHPITIEVQSNCRIQDSLELVRFYNATGGPDWKQSWDLEQPINAWYGVHLNDAGCVTCLDMDGMPTCTASGQEGGNGLRGELIDLQLPKLDSFFISGNDLGGHIPDFSGLGNLETLFIGANGLNGQIPNFSNLPKLLSLTISRNQLSGAVPDFNSITNLKTLNLSGNTLIGNVPNFSHLPKLEGLNLSSNQLVGEIPDFSNLPSLTILSLVNNELTGGIPDFQSIPELERLHLSGNEIADNIPDFSNLPNLQYLVCHDCQLHGKIPNFQHLPRLKMLQLYINKLSGTIPQFDLVDSLQSLLVAENKFTFNHILNSIDTIKAKIDRNTIPLNTYYYFPQDSIYVDTIITAVKEMPLTIDLGIDEELLGSTYNWYKNTMEYKVINGNNKLTFNNFQPSDTGTYHVQITNPRAPDLTLYSRAIKIQLKNIPCLTVPLPKPNLTQLEFCQENSIPTLSVQPIEDLSFNWYGSNNEILLTGSPTYQPIKAGIYWVESVDDKTQCASEKVKVTLTKADTPSIQLFQKICNPDQGNYKAIVEINNADELNTSFGSLQKSESSDFYFIEMIPNEVDLAISASNSSGCEAELSISSDCCNAAAPIIPVPQQTICREAESPVEFVAEITNPETFTVDWYDAPLGGNLLLSNSLTFSTDVTGAYFAQARRLDDESCISFERTEVLLGFVPNDNPAVEEYFKECNPGGETYTVKLIIENADFISSTPPAKQQAEGRYTIEAIPLTDEVQIAAINNESGCQTRFTSTSPTCGCTDLPLPEPLRNRKDYCEGRELPHLQVEVPAGYTANWYDKPDGGNLLQQGALTFRPARAGDYYAETALPGQTCPDNGRIRLTLEELSADVRTVFQDTCEIKLAGSIHLDEDINLSGCDSITRIIFRFPEETPPEPYAGEDQTICLNGEAILLEGNSGRLPPDITGKWTTLNTDVKFRVLDGFSILVESIDSEESSASFIWALSTPSCNGVDRDTVSVTQAVGIELTDLEFSTEYPQQLKEVNYLFDMPSIPANPLIRNSINEALYGEINFYFAEDLDGNQQPFFDYVPGREGGTELFTIEVCDEDCPEVPCEKAEIRIHVNCVAIETPDFPTGFRPSLGEVFNPYELVLSENCSEINGRSSLTIYDQWQRVVFHSLDPQLGWNGKNGMHNLPTDSYYWVLKITFEEKEIIRKGSILLFNH